MSRRQTALVVEGAPCAAFSPPGCWMRFWPRAARRLITASGYLGAVNLAAFLAGQQGRNHNVITDYSCRPEFINLAKFLRGGHWLDLDWLWAITIRECRLDLARFAANPVPLTVVTTRVADGQAAYLKANAAELEQQIKASCSVPLVYRDFVRIDGEAMTDGGVADSIPVRHAYEQGRATSLWCSPARWVIASGRRACPPCIATCCARRRPWLAPACRAIKATTMPSTSSASRLPIAASGS